VARCGCGAGCLLLPSVRPGVQLGPTLHGFATQERDCRFFLLWQRNGIRCERCNYGIALVCERDREDRHGMSEHPLYPEEPRSPSENASRDSVPWRKWLVIRAEQDSIANAVDFVVVRDAGCAAAKTDLGAEIKMKACSARSAATAEGLTQPPLIDRKRPVPLPFADAPSLTNTVAPAAAAASPKSRRPVLSLACPDKPTAS
jgi:hypothetical protein